MSNGVPVYEETTMPSERTGVMEVRRIGPHGAVGPYIGVQQDLARKIGPRGPYGKAAPYYGLLGGMGGTRQGGHRAALQPTTGVSRQGGQRARVQPRGALGTDPTSESGLLSPVGWVMAFGGVALAVGLGWWLLGRKATPNVVMNPMPPWDDRELRAVLRRELARIGGSGKRRLRFFLRGDPEDDEGQLRIGHVWVGDATGGAMRREDTMLRILRSVPTGAGSEGYWTALGSPHKNPKPNQRARLQPSAGVSRRLPGGVAQNGEAFGLWEELETAPFHILGYEVKTVYGPADSETVYARDTRTPWDERGWTEIGALGETDMGWRAWTWPKGRTRLFKGRKVALSWLVSVHEGWR